MISGKAFVAGVMGWPVGHSRSPRLHHYWLERHGLDGAYVPLPVETQYLEQALRALPVLGFRGVSLTLPHKEAALWLVDQVDPLARRVGAINTVVVREGGTLEGYNTDVYGFAENLRSSGFALMDKPAIVLGAGGAARSVVVALQDMGCPEIRIVNRSRQRAEQLAAGRGDGIKIFDWNESAQALQEAGLFVNATSLGMTGQPPLEIDMSPLSAEAWVTDVIYAPLETDVLRHARLRGLRAVDGLGMLLYQAQPAFHAWFGVKPDVDAALRQFVLEDL